MKIGILGSGAIGGALGRLWTQAGHEVLFSSRHPAELDELAARAGVDARTGTADEAIDFADVLLEAIPYHAALKLSPDRLAGKTLLTASNYYPHRDGDVDLEGLSQTELLARRLPETKVVKVFNMMYAEEMEARAQGRVDRELAIFLAGDDEQARELAAGLVRDAKFEPVDAGALEQGRYFESTGPLYAQRWTAEEARAELEKVRAQP